MATEITEDTEGECYKISVVFVPFVVTFVSARIYIMLDSTKEPACH